MRVLITGVAGFIGSNFADMLIATQNKDCDVIGIDNLSYGLQEQIPAAVKFHKLDIRSKDIYPVFEGVDFVYHFAAKNCLADCRENPVDTADINVTGTVNVFEAARRAKVKKVVYAESSALYEGSAVLPTPESEVAPESFYSVSKLASMHFAKAYERYYGLNSTALRYFCVYGPRQDYRRTIPPVMSAFIVNLLKRRAPTIYGTGEKRRDFVHVDDVNSFHLRCMTDKRTDGMTYNIGSGENYSVLDIYRKLSGLLGIEIEPDFKDNLPGEALTTLADITAARKLGWQPKVNIDDGLRSMIECIKEQMRLGNIR
jgi:UDP-glucose 4-epimerase